MLRFCLGLFALLLACVTPAVAESLPATERFTTERLAFDVTGTYTGYTLTVSGPQGYYAQVRGARSAPTLRLRDHGDVPDGQYQYELVAATALVDQTAIPADQRNNGREATTRRPLIGASTTGAFRVESGRIQALDPLAEE